MNQLIHAIDPDGALRHRHPRAMQREDRLVLICGCSRSGTTWLWELLNAHPETASIMPSDFLMKDTSTERGEEVASMETGCFMRCKDEWIIEIFTKKRIECPDKVLIEKTPLHVNCLPDIFALYPNVRVVIVRRDPRATIASIVYALSSLLNEYAPERNDAWAAAIELYRHATISGLKYADDPRVHFISYEALCENGVLEMAQVFDFAGLTQCPLSDLGYEPRNATGKRLAQLPPERKEQIEKAVADLIQFE